jgi:hypothetical protein
VRIPGYAIAASGQIQASSYPQIANLQSEPCSDAEGGYDIGSLVDGSWLEFDNIDFGNGPTTLDVRWASAGSGGTLEFHLDSASGPTIAQGALPVTGGWQNMADLLDASFRRASFAQGVCRRSRRRNEGIG